MIATQEKDFMKMGGIRERMHAARIVARNVDWRNVIRSRLNEASTEVELHALAAELCDFISKATLKIKKQNGWQ